MTGFGAEGGAPTGRGGEDEDEDDVNALSLVSPHPSMRDPPPPGQSEVPLLSPLRETRSRTSHKSFVAMQGGRRAFLLFKSLPSTSLPTLPLLPPLPSNFQHPPRLQAGTLIASPSILPSSGGECVVAWTRKHAVAPWHGAWWIGAYLETDDIAETVPVKYHVLHNAASSGKV